MKKITTLAIISVLVLSFTITGLAVRPTTITSTVDEPGEFDVLADLTVQPNGNSQPPIIKCKWEFAKEGQWSMDCDPTKPYTQVDPPMVFQDYVPVEFYVVITDPDNVFEARDGRVEIDLFHPENAGDNEIMEPGDGSFKDNIILTLIDNNVALSKLQNIQDHSLEDIIWFNDPYDLADVIEELQNNLAFCFKATYYKYYHQPAGWYRVVATAFDVNGVESIPFTNYFEYTLGVGVEIDFDEVNWSTVHVSTPKWFSGNWVFDATEVDPQMPTIRNIGNWDVELWLNFSNMGFGKSSDGQNDWWDVEFDARVGNTFGDNVNNTYEEENNVPIYPEIPVQLPIDNSVQTGGDYRDDALMICHTAKLSFMIHVLKATHGYNYDYGGPITIIPMVPDYLPDEAPFPGP